MVLDLINKYKDQYKELISNGYDSRDGRPVVYDELYKWESLKTFQDNWNIDAHDFKSMYESSFANTLSNNLWEGQFFFPKRTMLEFIDRDPDLIQSMFKELYNEGLDIDGRIDRFIYHCDELRDDIMRSNPKYQHHYHDGYRMISVYLAFMYPRQYTIYKYTEYKNFMALIKARSIPGTREIGRFFKVMRTVYGIISKDEELIAMHRALREGRDDLYQEESLLLAQDFYWCCGNYF